MVNKRRFRDNYKASLGRHHFSRADILVIEKLLREYADAYDERILRRYPKTETKKIHKRTRKFADIHVRVGHYRHKFPRFGWGEIEIDYSGVGWHDHADSIKFLSNQYQSIRYFQIKCHPGITVTIKPFSCELYVNRQYANGNELRVIDTVAQQIKSYISSLPDKFVSDVHIGK